MIELYVQFMNKKHDYVNTIYDENLKPFTNYPGKLAKYLISRLNMNQGSKILELGCGRGEFINAFIEGGLEGYGLDMSEYSKKKYPRQSLIRKEEGIVLLEIIIRNDGALMSIKSVKAKFFVMRFSFKK